MKLLAFQKEDISHLSGLQPDGWPDIQKEFALYLSRPFCRPYKLIAKDQIRGLGAYIHYGATAWLAHIIVQEQDRNKGFGRFIVKELVHILEQEKVRTISLIATDLGYPVYKTCGFKEQTRYLFFEGGSADKIDKKDRSVGLYQPEDRDSILALDRKISGENRAMLLDGFIRGAMTYKEAGKIKGVYFPDLGEGTILADSRKPGHALLKIRNQSKQLTVIPAENRAAQSFLEEKGFHQSRSAVRMVFGDAFDYRPECIFSRIAGNFG